MICINFKSISQEQKIHWSSNIIRSNYKFQTKILLGGKKKGQQPLGQNKSYNKIRLNDILRL